MAKGRIITDILYFFFIRIVDLWINLPVNVRTLGSFCYFKSKVNNFYFDKFSLLKIRFYSLDIVDNLVSQLVN